MDPKIQRDLKRRVGGRQFEGGKGVPDRRGDEQGSLLGLLPTPGFFSPRHPEPAPGDPDAAAKGDGAPGVWNRGCGGGGRAGGGARPTCKLD